MTEPIPSPDDMHAFLQQLTAAKAAVAQAQADVDVIVASHASADRRLTEAKATLAALLARARGQFQALVG